MHSGETSARSKELMTLEFFMLKFVELGWDEKYNN
jgi:hypothetical protein